IDSKDSRVRTAAVNSASVLKIDEAGDRVTSLLNDSSVDVRRAACIAAGRLSVKQALQRLKTLARDSDVTTRAACLASLRTLGDGSAVPEALDSLQYPDAQLAALNYLREFGSPEVAAQIAMAISTSRSIDVLTAAVETLVNWRSRQTTNPQQREDVD